jgi:hypothetical protein
MIKKSPFYATNAIHNAKEYRNITFVKNVLILPFAICATPRFHILIFFHTGCRNLPVKNPAKKFKKPRKIVLIAKYKYKTVITIADSANRQGTNTGCAASVMTMNVICIYRIIF